MGNTGNKIWSEKKLEKLLFDGLKLFGGRAIKFHSVSDNGFPDRLVVSHRNIAVAEIKTTGKELDPLQVYWRAWLEVRGVKYFFINDDKTLEECLKYMRG